MQRWIAKRLIESGLRVFSKSTTYLPTGHISLQNSPRIKGFHTSPIMAYEVIEKGTPNTMDYRMYFSKNGNVVSPFHDIPLYADAEKKVLNMVVEIPRWTNHKMEVNKEEKLNPIKQDVKKGKVRFVKNVFPHHGYIWNYGALPQTWEDPNHTDDETGTKGDNDPLDVCEIGYKIHKRGAVIQVKILGTMCLIDEGETDWKIICIDVTDPLAKDLNDIPDVEKHMPGFLKATNEWFKIYKMPDGKPANTFAFNGEAKSRDYASKVVEECHKHWKNLIAKDTESSGICCENTGVAGSPYLISKDDAKKVAENILGDEGGAGATKSVFSLFSQTASWILWKFGLGLGEQSAKSEPAPLPDDVDMWHYVKL